MADFETLQVNQRQAVMEVTLNRPKANAFNVQMIDELLSALKTAGSDDGVRCLMLTGSGRIFSAGQDVNDFEQANGDVSFRDHLNRTYNRLIPALRRLEKPILAAINGPVAGAGLGVALATDLRIASDRAKFFFGFSGIGLTADSGTSLTLPMLVGLARASEMAFTNQPVSAERALEYGLVNRVVPDDDLLSAARLWADELAQGPTFAIGLTKRAFNQAVLGNLHATLDYEAHLQEMAGRSDDHQEGLAAFREKRPPDFQGR